MTTTILSSSSSEVCRNELSTCLYITIEIHHRTKSSILAAAAMQTTTPLTLLTNTWTWLTTIVIISWQREQKTNGKGQVDFCMKRGSTLYMEEYTRTRIRRWEERVEGYYYYNKWFRWWWSLLSVHYCWSSPSCVGLSKRVNDDNSRFKCTYNGHQSSSACSYTTYCVMNQWIYARVHVVYLPWLVFLLYRLFRRIVCTIWLYMLCRSICKDSLILERESRILAVECVTMRHTGCSVVDLIIRRSVGKLCVRDYVSTASTETEETIKLGTICLKRLRMRLMLLQLQCQQTTSCTLPEMTTSPWPSEKSHSQST